jgi:hypothetical protein
LRESLIFDDPCISSSATVFARRAEREDILPGFEPQFLSQLLPGIT